MKHILICLCLLLPSRLVAQELDFAPPGSIELKQENGPLIGQLQREAALAAKAGQILFVEVGNTTCGNCRPTLKLFHSGALSPILHDVHVVYINYDHWQNELLIDGFPDDPMAFLTVTSEGKPEMVFDWSGIFYDDSIPPVETATRLLKQFLTQVRARHSQDSTSSIPTTVN